jgi:D-glycero-D-manno-heptose 1,7-bisphosphate phosphatase
LKLRNAGFMLIIVKNQLDVVRGTLAKSVVEGIHKFLTNNLSIDEFITCYHDSGDDCNCRKQLPGSFTAEAEQHGIDLDSSFMVGDRWRDIEAGRLARCKTIFIDYGYIKNGPSHSITLRILFLKQPVSF